MLKLHDFCNRAIVGYARLSTRDPSPAVQLDALHHAGCECVFTEKMSGAQRERPELKAALNYLNAGDTLMVWKLDRLARSTRQLVATTAELQRRNVGLRVLTQAIDTTMICPPLSGPETMIVWTTKGMTNAKQEAQAGRDYREAA
jgi:hypothetical protein